MVTIDFRAHVFFRFMWPDGLKTIVFLGTGSLCPEGLGKDREADLAAAALAILGAFDNARQVQQLYFGPPVPNHLAAICKR